MVNPPSVGLNFGPFGGVSRVNADHPLPVDVIVQPPSPNLFQRLTVNGDGTGDFNIDTDFSSVADDYYIQPGPAELYRVRIFALTLTQDGVDAMSLIGYGGSDAVLTNGMKLIQSTNGVEFDVLNITSNMVLTSLGLPVVGTGGKGGSSASFLTGRIILSEAILLDGSNPTPDRLTVRVNDDHTQFINQVHAAWVTGAIE